MSVGDGVGVALGCGVGVLVARGVGVDIRMTRRCFDAAGWADGAGVNVGDGVGDGVLVGAVGLGGGGVAVALGAAVWVFTGVAVGAIW